MRGCEGANVSLLDRLIEPTKDYISFRDFLLHLSKCNNEPLYEVVTYLLHHDFNSIGFYNIDTDYKIVRFEPFECNTVTEFLEEIQKALVLSADKWIFSSSDSLDNLADNDRRKVTTTVMKAMHSFFKKSEILNFKPLDGLLHFDSESTSDINNKSESVEQQLLSAKLEIERLKQAQLTGSSMVGRPAIGHAKPKTKTNEELIKELATANNKIKHLKEEIFQLEQADQLADDKELSTRSQNLAAKIILALLDIAELGRDSLPYQYDDLSSNNCIIRDQIKANGMKVGQQKIGHWLDLAINQATDK